MTESEMMGILLLTDLYMHGGVVLLLMGYNAYLLGPASYLQSSGYIDIVEDDFYPYMALTPEGRQVYKELTAVERLAALNVDHPVPTNIVNYIVNQLTISELPIALCSNSKLVRDLAKTRMYFLSFLPISFTKEI